MNPNEKLAKEIAQDLFTDGMGIRAERLVHRMDSIDQYRGGWSERAAADRILRILDANSRCCAKPRKERNEKR